MSLKEKSWMMKDLKTEKKKLDLEIDQKELELTIFHREELQITE